MHNGPVPPRSDGHFTKTAQRSQPLESAVLSTEQARALLGMGKSSFYEAVRRGDIPHFRIGHKNFYPRAGIERLITAALDRADAARAS